MESYWIVGAELADPWVDGESEFAMPFREAMKDPAFREDIIKHVYETLDEHFCSDFEIRLLREQDDPTRSVLAVRPASDHTPGISETDVQKVVDHALYYLRCHAECYSANPY